MNTVYKRTSSLNDNVTSLLKLTQMLEIFQYGFNMNQISKVNEKFTCFSSTELL